MPIDDEFLGLAGRGARRAVARREGAGREGERGTRSQPSASAESSRSVSSSVASPARSRQAMRTSSWRRRRRNASMNPGSSACEVARPETSASTSPGARARPSAPDVASPAIRAARAPRNRARTRWRRRPQATLRAPARAVHRDRRRHRASGRSTIRCRRAPVTSFPHCGSRRVTGVQAQERRAGQIVDRLAERRARGRLLGRGVRSEFLRPTEPGALEFIAAAACMRARSGVSTALREVRRDRLPGRRRATTRNSTSRPWPGSRRPAASQNAA